MAREKRYVPLVYEPVQEEMTVVVVKFKGGPESMQKGFDAVNNAIAALASHATRSSTCGGVTHTS